MTPVPEVGGPVERTSAERVEQLRTGLFAVQDRISAACEAAGRAEDRPTLVVVTKTYPAADVMALTDLGVRDVGENRDQEAHPKRDLLVAAGVTHLRWHFIGQLQTNKAGSVARYADVVQSVDRPSLAAALGKGARAAERVLSCLVQVSLDPDAPVPGTPGSRGGVQPADVEQIAESIAAEPNLLLGGLMAVAPVGEDPLKAFAILRSVRDRLLAVDDRATVISAGMSGDLEAAVACGATHLRVGSAVLGARGRLQ